MFLYSPKAYMTSASASSLEAWAVWPSCQRNSLVRRKSRVDFVSHRTMLHHWLIFIGRSRQLRIHLEKVAYIIVSLVGLIATFSSSSVSPPWLIHATSGVKPAKCSASFFSRLSGINIGKY